MSSSPTNVARRRAGIGMVAFGALIAAAGLAACAPSDPEPPELDTEAAPAPLPEEPAEVQEPAQEPVEEPAEEPAEEPVDEPAEEPVEEPAEEPVEEPVPEPLDGRLIAIDPGHNGGNFDAPDEIAREVDAGPETKQCNTVGAVADDGYRGSTFNIELARRLRAMLEARGAEVVMTREDDDGVGPCIDERGSFGQDTGADLMISIHADGAAEDGHGFHVIRPGGWEGQSEEVVERSSRLATLVRDHLVNHGLTTSTYVGEDGIHARSDLGTLNLSEVPAILLEAGNMHNDDDLAMLRSNEGQDALGAALADAIEHYLDG